MSVLIKWWITVKFTPLACGGGWWMRKIKIKLIWLLTLMNTEWVLKLDQIGNNWFSHIHHFTDLACRWYYCIDKTGTDITWQYPVGGGCRATQVGRGAGGDAISTTKPLLPVECICPKQNFPKYGNERLDTIVRWDLDIVTWGGDTARASVVLFNERKW